MSNLSLELEEYRKIRNFNADDFIDKKTDKCIHFFKENKIDSVVIGISGGIDSALSLALMNEILKKGHLKKIWPILIPIVGAGTSNQDEALRKGKLICEHLNLEYHVCDVSFSFQNIVHQSFKPGNAWSQGQMASVLRTPVLYYHAALLQELGFSSLVVGTTNRDEGAYIGFFGKASDAMVDLQPIADLHKSEVYTCARLLFLPEEIIQAKPSGDVFDGKTDEEMIGSNYDFLELYQYWISNFPKTEIENKINSFDLEEQQFIRKAILSIESLHQKNLHKYQVGNPAHFLDVLERKVITFKPL